MKRSKFVIVVLLSILTYLFSLTFNEKQRQHDSILTGEKYYEELLRTPNENRFLHAARMSKECFLQLLKLLNEKGLKSSRILLDGEKLLIFIGALKGYSVRTLAERWQHSTATISDAIHCLMDALMRCESFLFIAPNGNEASDKLRDPKYSPFDGCIGAVDGTHIPAFVKTEEQAPFRNRKGFISQNVLAVANFDMTFSYCLAGWEGSAHDGRVFQDALRKDASAFFFPSKATVAFKSFKNDVLLFQLT